MYVIIFFILQSFSSFGYRLFDSQTIINSKAQCECAESDGPDLLGWIAASDLKEKTAKCCNLMSQNSASCIQLCKSGYSGFSGFFLYCFYFVFFPLKIPLTLRVLFHLPLSSSYLFFSPRSFNVLPACTKLCVDLILLLSLEWLPLAAWWISSHKNHWW